MNRRVLCCAVAVAAATWSQLVQAADGEPRQDASSIAAAFGARLFVRSPELSPDGKKLVFVAPVSSGKANVAMTMDLTTGDSKPVMEASGAPLKLYDCNWSADNRIVCLLAGVDKGNAYAMHLSFSRIVSFDADGRNQISLARGGGATIGLSQYDGQVIDWLSGKDGSVLMTRNFLKQQATGSLMGDVRSGLGVDRVNTRNNVAQIVEQPLEGAESYLSDGDGVVRVMAVSQRSDSGMLRGRTDFRYRVANEKAWRSFSSVEVDGAGLRPIAVDGVQNVAYAVQKTNGLDALYKVALDGSMKSELVYANPQVDIDGVETIGRHGKVIAADYNTDQPYIHYIDAAYAALAAQLAKALPDKPSINFVSASADDRKLLILAGGLNTPGHYYLLDRDTHAMGEVMPARPELEKIRMGEVKFITYPAADGTPIPAYLTLPPGSGGRNLPALVLPHGGPASRDYGGFDELSQFFAHRGFAVIQPEYRGSTGFGNNWGTALKNNAIKGWRIAIGDVLDAGHWMVKQGIADPAKLAIFGWSYGGYAALQSNVVDPTLFKAVVAVAPLTDFGLAKAEHQEFVNANIVNEQFGGAALAQEGSPDRHAASFQAPVLMFQGDNDINVDVSESRAMDAALRRAGKESRLVIYPGLDHQLDDSKALADMFFQSDAFLRAKLGLKP